MKRANTIAVAAGLCLIATAAIAQAPRLPAQNIPKALAAYLDAGKVANAVEHAIKILRGTTIEPEVRSIFKAYYHDHEFPKLSPSAAGGAYTPSPCERDQKAMAVHRGHAWMALAYRLFATKVEDHPTSDEFPWIQDLYITRPGRSKLLSIAKSDYIASFLFKGLQGERLDIQARSDIAAFLRLLLQFREHHDLFVSKKENIRYWLSFDYSNKHGNPKLVEKLNSFLSLDGDRVNECYEGHADFIVTLPDKTELRISSIYGHGIARYAMGFWWRRDGEGTTALAAAALKYVIDALER